jgi:hypothetical protein
MADDSLPVFEDGTAYEAVEAALIAAELHDGLPVVPPTAARIAAMVRGVADPQAQLGFMPPMFGEVTPVALAWCAVAAGCRPPELPVVTAAALATLEDQFNLLGLMTTTGSAAVATVVHGPLVAELGLNASVNCMGPGNRANAAIGRALALALRNIGGARPESGDMATVGQPGKYVFCFAEPHSGPLVPFHVRRGLAEGQSAVTVLGVSGTAEVLPLDERDTPEAILDPMALSMAAAFVANGAYRQPVLPEHPFVLPPEMAAQIVAKGWDLARIQAHLHARARHDGQPIAAGPEAFQPIVTGGPGVKMAHLPLWGGGSRMVTRPI